MKSNSELIAEAIEIKGKEGVWNMYEKARIGSPLKEEAAMAYLELCTKPQEIWKLYSHMELDQNTKSIAWAELEKFEKMRAEALRRVVA